MNQITGRDVALFLGFDLLGENLAISKPADLAEAGPGALVWLKRHSKENQELIEQRRPALVICDSESADLLSVPRIASDNPRLDFIRAISHFFAESQEVGIHPTAIIGEGAAVGRNVNIGAYVRIGPKVTIGEGCNISSGVSIEGEVVIGNRCFIKANSAIGGAGFGFEYARDGTPIHFPHIGRVVLEDDVWLGACTTIERATLGTTRLCKGSKIDDLVQIGHNSTIGENTLIMANAVICGGAVVGKHCWIAPNSVIKEHVILGDRVVVGLGAVVLKDVTDGLTVAGVPARPLR